MAKNQKIVFIGLGNMGLPMACNLAKKRPGLLCADIFAPARKAAKKAGLRVAQNARELAAADIVVTMLPSGAHVRELWQSAGGAPASAKAGALFVDCSTTSPEEAREFCGLARARGGRFVDSPVSGGIVGAKAATLSFLAGGAAADLAQAKPLLRAMGANIFHAGGVGAGQAAKICNNMMVSVSMIATCEALHLGRKMGLDAATLSDIMKKSSGGSWVTEKYNPVPGVMPNVPAAKNYAGGFVVDLMLKDSDLAMRAANAAGAATPLGALANQIYRLHQQNGGGRLDFGSVWRLIEGMAAKGKK